jgi:hypothetical protein
MLTQWTLAQHRVDRRGPGREFREALDRGVTDRTVFAWERGRVARTALVTKPVRVLQGPEAAGLGGRGEFELVGVRAPQGPAAWTTVEVAARTGQAEDALVLEIGGEINVERQVLETVLLQPPGEGRLELLPLARRALLPSPGVPVYQRPFGLPVAFPGRVPYHEAGGTGFLVARSDIEAIPDGGMTPQGPADLARPDAGKWREGDRVYLRIPLATLRAGAPALVLGWKDRIFRDDPDGELLLRRLSFGTPSGRAGLRSGPLTPASP